MSGEQFGRRPIDAREQGSSELLAKAIAAAAVFEHDWQWIPHEVNRGGVQDPSIIGEYSYRAIAPEVLKDPDQRTGLLERLAKGKVLIWQCMDRRTAFGVEEELVRGEAGQTYSEDEVVRVNIAGGAVQRDDGKEGLRETAMMDIFRFLAAAMPGVEEVVVSAHTSDIKKAESGPCGGITKCCEGNVIVSAASDVMASQVASSRISELSSNPEVQLTAVALAHALNGVSEIFPGRTVRAMLAIPNEQTGGVELKGVTPYGDCAVSFADLLRDPTSVSVGVVPRRLV